MDGRTTAFFFHMFFQPQTLEEALALKRQHGATAAFLAGGTDLVVQVNHRRSVPDHLIDLSRLRELAYVQRVGDSYHVGGATTFADLARLPGGALAEAAGSVGGPQIRNRATIAGNLATASPAADGATALLALDAVVTLRNSDGERQIALEEFFLDYRKTRLAADEIISRVSFSTDWRSGWFKLGKRGAVNISLVCCAAGTSPSGVVRIAFGSVGPYPLRAHNAEECLAGFLAHGVRVDGSEMDEVCRLAMAEVRPIDDFRGSSEYRRAMCGVALRKVLRGLLAG